MLSRFAASCLCLLMSATLVAQETVSVAPPLEPAAATAPTPEPAPVPLTLKKGTEVELVLLETVSSATAVKGQPVRFAVAKDVVADGLVVIPKGAPAAGVVTTVQKAVRDKRDGYVVVEPRKVEVGNGAWASLRDTRPGVNACDDFCPSWGVVAAILVFSPIIVAGLVLVAPWVLIAWLSDRKNEIEGRDQVIQPCWRETMYTAAEVKLPAPAASAGQPALPEEIGTPEGCPERVRIRPAP
jgi:hypothetical protein